MQIANGNNLSRVKVTNQSAIRQMIYHDGPISRIEISEKLSLTRQDVSDIMFNNAVKLFDMSV